MARPCRTLPAAGSLSPATAPQPIPDATMLVVGTFGWWEIICPTASAVQALCARLAATSVQVCCVTGLPAAVVQDVLDGRFGYAWVGDMHHHTRGVGLLVAVPWRRVFCKLPGSTLGAGTYGPCVGAIPVEEHKDWITETVDIARVTAQKYGLRHVWLFGDLNMRGVVPGSSVPPVPGSSHANTSEFFRSVLREVGWTALASGPTHSRGGALDAHVTDCTPCGTVCVGKAIDGCPSDHLPTYVPVQRVASTGEVAGPVIDQRGVLVFEWVRDETRWRAALGALEELPLDLSYCYRAVAAEAVARPPRGSQRRAIATAALGLCDTLMCFAGHGARALLLKSQKGGKSVNSIKNYSGMADHIIGAARSDHQRLLATAACHPEAINFARAIQVQSNWQRIIEASRGRLEKPFLHQTWLQAAQGGDVALQRWFSSKAVRASPKLQTRSDQAALAIASFRADVGRLDTRCDSAAEEVAMGGWQAERCRRTCRLRTGRPLLETAAANRQELDCSLAPPLFTTSSTVCRLIRRRPARKASSKVTWAAMRAASASEPWLRLVHGVLELDWAVAEFDEGSLLIEVEHLHKGKGKPTDQESSYRPIGLAHPMTSLRSDVLRLRQRNGLIELAGATQLGGLRDPRLIVVARDEAACRRRHAGLPNANLAGDARFGYDGGRQARFMASASAARPSDRDWLLTDRLLTGHRLMIRDYSDEGCVALIPVSNAGGGGTIQGISISGPLYNPTTVECVNWSAAMVPFACTDVHPVVAEAFRRTRTLEPEGYWHATAEDAQSVAWAIERAIYEAETADNAATLLERCVGWMSALATDAERLLVLDMIGQSGGEARVAFVDDFKARYSSPWAAKQGGIGISNDARHNGVVYEGGQKGKLVVTLDGFPPGVAEDAELRFGPFMQGEFPRAAEVHELLGMPEGSSRQLPAYLPARKPALTNKACRVLALKKIGVQSAIGLRVAVGKATECPWPLVARRYYLSRLDAKVAYLTPMVIGLRAAGLRVTSIQAKWALAAITGQVSWPKALKVPGALRRRLCEDLGWPCLWATSKASAISLLCTCQSDHVDFAHTQLSSDVENMAPGGWMDSVSKLRRAIGDADWRPVEPVGSSARKRAIAKHRREAVLPALLATSFDQQCSGPLPWAWIAANGNVTFPRQAFDAWWQLRGLGVTHPRHHCPWCHPAEKCTREHLESACQDFAMKCWTKGVRPEEAFLYPIDDHWFRAVLSVVAELSVASSAAKEDFEP